MSELVLKSLTEPFKQAQSGLKKDVALLIEALQEGGLYLSLATALNLPDENTPPPPEAPLSTHLLKHPDGSYYVCLFTESALAKKAQSEAGWSSDQGTQEVCILPARNALYYAYKLMLSNEQVVGTFVNPYDETGIQLNPLEIEHLFNGNPIPFESYARQTPLGPEEAIHVRPADVSSIPEFTEATQNFVAQNTDIERYEVVAMFDEQRDMTPYLAINFHTQTAPSSYPTLAQSYIQAVQGKIPERLEVMFNEKMPGML